MHWRGRDRNLAWRGVVTLRAPEIAAPAQRDFGRIALSGVLSMLFAWMPMLRPKVGAIGLAWVIAGYALVLVLFGIMRVLPHNSGAAPAVALSQ